jgi:hypothetical protein
LEEGKFVFMLDGRFGFCADFLDSAGGEDGGVILAISQVFGG